MALGTGLRLSELLGLNVGDVSPDWRQVRGRIVLAVTKGSRRGEVFLPARLARTIHEAPAATADLLAMPGVLAARPLNVSSRYALRPRRCDYPA